MTGKRPSHDPVREVLSAVATLSRDLSSEQQRPFEGRVFSTSQMSVLFLLARNPTGLTPGRLAELLAVSAGAVTQLVEVLKSEGHVDVRANPEDARSRLILLSQSARTEVESFELATVERLRPKFAALSRAELAILAVLLSRVTTESND